MSRITRLLEIIASPWHSPPWQASFYAEARGHSLRTRIGRLLEPTPPKEHVMRMLTLFTVVTALLAAGAVRVQLVAVAQEPTNETAPDSTAAETTPEKPTTPAGPPTKVERELLTYDGKRFEDYEAILASELAPDRRAEAIKALTAFAPSGFAEEVAKIILAEMRSFDERRYNDQRTLLLRDTCRIGLREINPEVARPLLIAALRDDNYGVRRLGLQCIREKDTSDELYEVLTNIIVDESQASTVRAAALHALNIIDPRYLRSQAIVLKAVTAENASSTLRRAAADSIAIEKTDTPEFLQEYSRNFATPLLVNYFQRSSGATASAAAMKLLRLCPEASFEALLNLAVLDEQSVGSPDRTVSSENSAFVFEALLGDPVWFMDQVANRYDQTDDEAKLQYLKFVSNLIRRQVNFRSNETLAKLPNGGIDRAITFLGEASQSENRQISEEALYLLSAIGRNRSAMRSGIYELAREELRRRGVTTNEEWEVKYRLMARERDDDF
jgi:hypothetical protein